MPVNLPGLKSASSSKSNLFVAPITMTVSLVLNPSNSTKVDLRFDLFVVRF